VVILIRGVWLVVGTSCSYQGASGLTIRVLGEVSGVVGRKREAKGGST
jgi:hypothetical protein